MLRILQLRRRDCFTQSDLLLFFKAPRVLLQVFQLILVGFLAAQATKSVSRAWPWFWGEILITHATGSQWRFGHLLLCR